MKHLPKGLVAGGLLCLIATPLAYASETHTVTLAFETDQLDFDSGVVSSDALDQSSTSGTSDILVAYNATRANKAVMVLTPAEGGTMAFLENTGLNDVSADTLSGMAFTSETEDRAVTVFDTVVVQTDTGAYYKLGNLSEADDSVTFDYQLVE